MSRKTILYNPKIPRLDGLTESQRNRAIEDYMRESAKQINIIIRQLQEAAENDVET